MSRKLLILGSILGLMAVILGAFGAHGLKQVVDADAVASFETGVRYQIYHAFLALFMGALLTCTEKRKKVLFYLLLFGVVLFSGSIYLLATQQATGMDFSNIALFTPLGGGLLIISWGIMLYTFVKR